MARFAVIVMCPLGRAPPSTMRLIAASATKRPTEHNADYVPGHIIGELLESGIFKDAARVGGRLGENGEGKVAVFGSNIRVHGLLSFERLGRAMGVARTARGRPPFPRRTSWLAPVRAPVLRSHPLRGFRARRE